MGYDNEHMATQKSQSLGGVAIARDTENMRDMLGSIEQDLIIQVERLMAIAYNLRGEVMPTTKTTSDSLTVDVKPDNAMARIFRVASQVSSLRSAINSLEVI